MDGNAKPGESEVVSGNPIVGNFNLTQQMPNGRTMQMAGYLYHGQRQEEIDATLDLYQDVMERQRCRLEVVELELRLTQLQEALSSNLEAHSALLKRAEGDGRKLTAAERQHMEQVYPKNLEKIRNDIEQGKQKIEEMRRKGGLE